MTKRLKHNLKVLSLYTIIIYLILLPLQLYIISIPISILLGFLFECLNEIITQLRKLNGEKFDNIE